MMQRRRLALGGGVVAAVELAAGITEFMLAGPVTIARFLVTCAVATGTTTATVVALMGRPGGPGAPPGAAPGGGAPPDDPDSPSWWPTFERDFREHARKREGAPV